MFSPTDNSVPHKNAKSSISVKDIVFTRTPPERCYDGSAASDADPICSRDHGYVDVVRRYCTLLLYKTILLLTLLNIAQRCHSTDSRDLSFRYALLTLHNFYTLIALLHCCRRSWSTAVCSCWEQ
jgi:hypothetical protein